MAVKITDKRDAILNAALKLIAERGFHGTPMSKVAQEAGVSAGIIYHYFESKDDLINELYRQVKQQFARAVTAKHNNSLPLPDQLGQVVENSIRYFVHHPEATIFIEQYMRSPYNLPEIEAEVNEQYAELHAMIEEAKQEGIIKDLPLPVLYSLTLDVASSVAQKHAAGLLELTEETTAQIVGACWDAVRR